MSDALQAVSWSIVLAGGIGACVGLRAIGVRRTHVRDVLHVGAGVWVLGWKAWRSPVAPIAITLAAALAVSLLPRLARRRPALARVVSAVSDDDERWSGIVLYVASFAGLTAFALLVAPFPAAAGLLALALGDGLGGFVGRRFGAHRYTIGGAKPKSLEGSFTVFAASVLAIAAASLWCGAPVSAVSVVAAGLIAAGVEAAAPRGTDNVLVPAAVCSFLAVLGRPS
jgi:dolichol kinase